MANEFRVRLATPADAAALARHRAEIFRDTGELTEEQYAPFVEAVGRDLNTWLEAGEYVGWVATLADCPQGILAGAGIHLRKLLARPRLSGAFRVGPEAIVLNVFTERAWRRRGLARRLMEEVIDWARAHGVVRLVLHASPEGRPLYESLGFEPTNEMRYTGELAKPETM